MNYTVKQAAEILGVKERAVQTKCKNYNVIKKGNKYLITKEIIHAWEHDNANATNANATNANLLNTKEIENANANANAQIDLHVQALELEIEELKEELKKFETTENERVEVFTNEEYAKFEKRLKDWYIHKNKIKEQERQEQLFKAETKNTTELYEHYKSQFEYQKKENDKVLEMHQKLIDTVENQSKIMLQRNFIEAKDKSLDKK